MATVCDVKVDDPAALATLAIAVERELLDLAADRRRVVFACIGTDRSTGDALGPLVGERLLRLGLGETDVVGSLENPLHALNLHERLVPLTGADRPLVVAVDAALGRLASVGSVSLRRGGLRPGQAVGKDLPEVGELALTATVNVGAGALDVQVLQSTRLFLVHRLAELIGVACWSAHRNVSRAAQAGRVSAAA